MKSRRGPPHCVHEAVVWPSVVAGAITSAASTREPRQLPNSHLSLHEGPAPDWCARRSPLVSATHTPRRRAGRGRRRRRSSHRAASRQTDATTAARVSTACAGDPEHETDAGKHETFTDERPHDPGGGRAKGHADADLLSPLRRRVARSIHTDRRRRAASPTSQTRRAGS